MTTVLLPSRISQRLLLASLLLLAWLMLAASPVDAAQRKAAPKPLVTSFSPAQVMVSETLKVSGKYFTVGQNRMVVVFLKVGGKRIYTRATASSKTQLEVTIPTAVLREMLDPADTDLNTPSYVDTTFRLRLISKAGLAKRFTTVDKSPTVKAGLTALPDPFLNDCDKDGVKDEIDSDDDNDLLSDVREGQLATDPCLPDTDNDGPTDYYESRVAEEFNGGPVLPYPGRTPYLNPLLADSGKDLDGDGITAAGEFELWQYTKRMDRFYSDANRDSDGDGLPDNLEDEDNDLLPNWPELMILGNGDYPLDWLATDTDGDGLCDGLDDQDHDGPPTPIASADCTTPVPNNTNPGDPNPSLIDGDDNTYSNWAELFNGTKAMDPCDPDPSPYCPVEP